MKRVYDRHHEYDRSGVFYAYITNFAGNKNERTTSIIPFNIYIVKIFTIIYKIKHAY